MIASKGSPDRQSKILARKGKIGVGGSRLETPMESSGLLSEEGVLAKITFILGGARSGKSSYAIDLAKNINGEAVYLATGVPCDEEMRTRIKAHKKKRPDSWETVEEPLNVEFAIKELDNSIKCVILDCLSFWVSNLILHYQDEEKVISKISQFLGVAKTIKPKVIIVSNEVGMGVVPDTLTGRIFRDILGRANQLVRDSADEVLFMVAGVPIKIK